MGRLSDVEEDLVVDGVGHRRSLLLRWLYVDGTSMNLGVGRSRHLMGVSRCRQWLGYVFLSVRERDRAVADRLVQAVHEASDCRHELSGSSAHCVA